MNTPDPEKLNTAEKNGNPHFLGSQQTDECLAQPVAHVSLPASGAEVSATAAPLHLSAGATLTPDVTRPSRGGLVWQDAAEDGWTMSSHSEQECCQLVRRTGASPARRFRAKRAFH